MRTKEVTEKLGISKSLLYKYCEDFNISPAKNEAGKLEFVESQIELLEKIISLREANGITTIIKKLNISPVKEKEKLPDISRQSEEHFQEISQNNEALLNRLEMIENNFLDTLEDKFKNVLVLAQEYSKTQYLLGESKAELKAERDKIEVLKEGNTWEISRMNKDLESLKIERDRERQAKEDLEKRLDKISGDLEREKNKSIWQRLFKR